MKLEILLGICVRKFTKFRFNHLNTVNFPLNYRRKIDLLLPDGETSKLVIATRNGDGYTLEFGDQSLEVSASLEDGQLICFVNGVKSIQRAVMNGPNIKLFSRDLGAVSFSQKLPKFLSQQIGGNFCMCNVFEIVWPLVSLRNSKTVATLVL